MRLKFKSVTDIPGRFHIQAEVSFVNGYGASIVMGDTTYGGTEGLFELAVTEDGNLCYETPITEGVLGFLTMEEVQEILKRIENLD